jgi:hypothetical protein
MERNYALEAERIATGESKLLPERAHLLALVAYRQAMMSHINLVSSLLAALMSDNNFPRLSFTKTLLESPAVLTAGLTIKREADGSVTVTRNVPPPPVEQPARVM